MPAKTLTKTKNRIARLGADRLARSVGWLTGAELVSRLGRILAAIVLARQLDAAAFGVAAVAVTIYELIRVFTENGVGAAVVRACDKTFHTTANTAYRLMWIVCLGLAAIQIGIGLAVETLLPGKDLGAMIALLAVTYLIMPFGLVHAYTLLRAQNMKRLAGVASAQAVTDHLLTAILALSGAGAWAIVLPKLLTTPVWLCGVLHGRPWKRDHAAGCAPVRGILHFSLPVLGAELLTAFRDQMDKVIVSLTLGVEALGLYYFAFNAGLGVSSALNRAFSNAIYPHLCKAADVADSYRRALFRLSLPLGLAYVAQAGAALVYVPIVFSERWASAAPLVALLCLGGPARLLVDGARMRARALGETATELLCTIGFAVSVLAPFALASSFGLYATALASVAGASGFALMLTTALFAVRLPAPSRFTMV